jgi:CheY-like chemotaxis protein
VHIEKQKIIFERFRQGSELPTRNYEGAGLGLSISNAFVEMLGGKIWMESNESKGSVFFFSLPYKKVEKPINTEDIETLESGSVIPLKKLKILIAEDDTVSAMLLTLVTNDYCDKVLYAKTGIEAIEIARNNHDLDLVLMDIKMPEMGGYEATRIIRQFNKKVIIIAQTAYGMITDREKALEAGCNDYISKPIDNEILLKKITNLVNRRGHENRSGN